MIAIRNFVKDLIEKYKTSSPFELCKELDINILFVDLPKDVNGFFLNSDVKKSILIRKELKFDKIKKVCAHELCHALLHTNVNAMNYEKDSEFIETLEKEADEFSKILLEYDVTKK